MKAPFAGYRIFYVFPLILPGLAFVRPVLAQDTLFIDSAVEAGLQGSANELQYGLAWGDFDNDGDVDLFIAARPANQLFRNNGDGTFTDIAANAGVEDAEMAAFGAAWGDFDGDGWLDLFVCNMGAVEDGHEAEDRLFRNNGDGTFTNVADEAGVSGHGEPGDHEHGEEETPYGGSVSAAWADCDLDGDLDLLVSNRNRGAVLYENQGDGTFHNATHEAGLELALHDPHEDDGHVETAALPAQVEEEPHEEEAVIGVDHAAWGDYNNDGYPDLFLSVPVVEEHDHAHEDDRAHDSETSSVPAQDDGHDHGEEEHTVTENRLFRNNGDGTFTETTDEAGVGDPNEAVTHSGAWGDFNRDGWLDLLVANLGSENEGTAAPQRLYRNNGDGTFTEVAAEAGIADEIYIISSAMADFNNDGWLDIAMLNHPSHADFAAGEFYEVPHPLFRSNGDGTFANINPDAVEALLETGVADINHLTGMAWADYDMDGDLDCVLSENHGDGPLLLYENHLAAAGNQWLQATLEQPGMNRFAVGARVTAAHGGGEQVQYAGQGGHAFASQNSHVVHFGLGDDEAAEVAVIWNDGTRETFGTLSAGSRHHLVRGQGTVTAVRDWMIR